jgi:hypothetical protein
MNDRAFFKKGSDSSPTLYYISKNVCRTRLSLRVYGVILRACTTGVLKEVFR